MAIFATFILPLFGSIGYLIILGIWVVTYFYIVNNENNDKSD